MTIDLRQFSSTLTPGPDGVWYGDRADAISYPQGGNEACLAVEEGSFWFQHRNRCICAALQRYPPQGVLFDLGGGNGFVSLALRGDGHQVVLVEPGLAGALAGRRRGLVPVACATLHSAGFREGSLPAVGLFDVVEHVQDDVAFLRQVAEALLSSGRVYITVPAYRFLWSSEDQAAGHWRRYSCESLVQAVEKAGLTVEYTSYFFRWLPLPIFLLRTLPSRLGFGQGRAAVNPARAHAGGPAVLRRWVEQSLQREAEAIGSGARLGFGGSVLLVASRPQRASDAAARAVS